MGGSESVRVTILGKEYPLQADSGSAETVKQIAAYVNAKISEFWKESPSKEEIKIAILTALNIAGELFEMKAKYEAEIKKTKECEEKIKSINSMMGNVNKLVS